MEYRSLDESELILSSVALGTWAIGGLFWGGQDENNSIAAIQRSIDEGVSTIDTAPVYGCGLSEQIVGKAIQGRRSAVQILTKFGLRWDTDEGTRHFEIESPEGKRVTIYRLATKKSIIHECEQSLRRLGVDHIDLYQHHWPDPVAPPEEIFAAAEKLIEQGKVRYLGVSNYSVEQLEAARRITRIVSTQPPYSMLRREIEKDLLPHCLRENIGVIAYSPLQMGLLTGKIDEEREFPETDIRSKNRLFTRENRKKTNEFLKTFEPIARAHGVSVANVVVNWTINQPGITCALVGARSATQAAENAHPARFKLSPEEMAKIDKELALLQLDR